MSPVLVVGQEQEKEGVIPNPDGEEPEAGERIQKIAHEITKHLCSVVEEIVSDFDEGTAEEYLKKIFKYVGENSDDLVGLAKKMIDLDTAMDKGELDEEVNEETFEMNALDEILT